MNYFSEKDIYDIVANVVAQSGLGKNKAAAPVCTDEGMEIPIEISARHVHLDRESLDVLFGKDYKLTKKRDLSQTGQYLAEERVKLVTERGQIASVGILGPLRSKNQVELSFNNVLVQHAEVTFNRYAAAPVTHHVGEGNADYFIGGVHLTGYWKRDNMESRTVFYTADGQELQLQRGKTFIIVCPKSTTITYE